MPRHYGQLQMDHPGAGTKAVQLSAIVKLSGHGFGGVLSKERSGPKDSSATCQDPTVFRIHVTPEGRVVVEKQPVEK